MSVLCCHVKANVADITRISRIILCEDFFFGGGGEEGGGGEGGEMTLKTAQFIIRIDYFL